MAGPGQGGIELSVVIVNYNGRRFLAECLRSIARHVSCPHEVIMVDNASSDGSCAYIRENHPAVKLIASPVNRGFTGGNNMGASVAAGRLLLLLNNDTRLLDDVAPAIEEFSDGTLGALGCRLIYGDGRQQLSIGLEHTPVRLVLSWCGLGGMRGMPPVFRRVESDHAQYALYQKSLAWVSGAALLTRKDVWDALGGLDENYFMYVEDVDYCKRVRQAGYRVAYTPAMTVMHYEGSGKPWIGSQALKRTMRSYLIYTRKYYGGLAVFGMRAVLALLMLARALVYAALSLNKRPGSAKEKLYGYLAASAALLKRS